MLTGKQRSFLKGISRDIAPAVIIGKNGITDNLIRQIDETLTAREIVKIKVLNNNFDDRKEMIEEILERLSCEFVQSIGNKLTIYRPSPEKRIELPKR
jgi:RNA-binding protein